jgi:Ser/Thr protein kinase RdoA (MazF antagonist)
MYYIDLSGTSGKNCKARQMIDIYQKLLNLQTATFSQIDHEDAMVAVVYKLAQPDGEQLILKVCDRPNDYLREVHFLKHFAEILPVPKIIEVVEPSEGIHGAILMQCLPGTLLKREELTETLAYELGRCLALIHLNRLHGYGDPMEGNLNPDPRIYFTLKFEEGLDECQHNLPIELIEQCRSYYKATIDLLMSVDGPCTTHRDFRPGNLIVHDGKLQGIIDWAGARASFAEEDFCSIEHGEWLHNPHNKKAFLAGYASIRPVPDYKKLVPFLRLNKAIATIGFTVKRGTWDNSSSRIYQYNRQFLETFFTAS